MPWKPSFRGERPTLGFHVLDWMTENLAQPDAGEYRPFVPYQEQAEFILRFYEIHPKTGKRVHRRAVLSRSRGWGKSPFLAGLALAEALADVVPDGWDAAGQPVGKPWELVRTPIVKLLAVSEAQVQNAWIPLLEMCDAPVVDNYPGLEPMQTFVAMPRGRIEPTTASAVSSKGNKPVLALMDQTEEWTSSNGGHRLAEVTRINAAKVGGATIESPNAFTPGVDSVAERSANDARAMLEGKTRIKGLLLDHREAPPETELDDRGSLLAGLLVAYGCSAAPLKRGQKCAAPGHKHKLAGHQDLDRIVADIWDPGTDPQTARADFLNQITHSSDAWVSQPEWAARAAPAEVVADGEAITLGFDGSRKRAKGVTDATALIGCRVSDGHLFEIGVWEQPEGPEGREWQVPTVEVEAAVETAFDRWRVVGFYADPAKWESHVSRWEARFGGQLRIKARRDHPCEWWMTGGRSQAIVRAIEQLHTAITDGEMTHDGSFALTRHVLNAHRKSTGAGIQIGKQTPDSPRKIDAAVAAILAFEARADAVSAGLDQEWEHAGFTF